MASELSTAAKMIVSYEMTFLSGRCLMVTT